MSSLKEILQQDENTMDSTMRSQQNENTTELNTKAQEENNEKMIDFNVNGNYSKFGKRAWPPCIKDISGYSITGRERLRRDVNFQLLQQTKLHQFLKEQKFKGFKVNKFYKVRKYQKVKAEVNGHSLPFFEIVNDSNHIPIPKLEFTEPNKPRLFCDIDYCGKSFTERSALNRHKKSNH
ncbi:hypothetical protein K502DRAFT_325755 [Neoconidiobolus thromboides FSU 785]|nr:hypothetical protein K502DRAFT_325755 [Neoconidiobolus thromboides FSU 785]